MADSTGRYCIPPEFLSALRDSLAHLPAGVDSEYTHYFSDLARDAGLAAFLRYNGQLAALAGGVRGKDVLDAGSGYGITANLFSVWGARRVFAVEYNPPRLTSHGRLNRSHFPWIRNVHVVRGSASRLPLGDRSLDLILSIEAISHYHDLEGFFRECARTLRPRGHLVISDGNNGDNPRIRAMTEDVWERFENGPPGMYGHHRIEEPLADRRMRLIRDLFPALEPERVRALALTTSGFDRSQIRQAIESHLAGGPPPSSRYRRGTLAREPEYGEVVERLFSPPRLAREIERYGFKARVHPHYGGARNNLLWIANEILRRIPNYTFARGFRLVAQRAG